MTEHPTGDPNPSGVHSRGQLDQAENPFPETAISVAQLIQLAAPLHVYAAWLPPEQRAVAGDAHIHDAGEQLPDRPGGVLLLAGSRPGGPDTADAVLAAGLHDYSAVIVKARGESLSGLIETAKQGDVALLVAPDDVPWRDLDTLFSTLIAAHEVADSGYAQVDSGDLFALANTIAYGVGGAVAIEDHTGRLFAYSNLPHQTIDEIRLQSITDRQTPHRDVDTERYLQVRNSTEPLRFASDDPQLASRLAIAVRAGGPLLGTIWVLDGDPPLGPGAEAALKNAAQIAALHLLQIRRQEDVLRWNRGEVLKSLLTGGITASAAAALVGIPAAAPTAVLAIAPNSPTGLSELEVARTIDLINLYCEAWHPQALITALDGVIYAILPFRPHESGGTGLVRFARDVVTTVHRTAGLTLRVGIGPIAEGLDSIPRCRQVATSTLDAIPVRGDGPQVATVEEMRSRIVLRELAGSGQLDLTVPGDPLRELYDHDSAHGTTYVVSLLAHLNAFGEAATAAKALCVHENTLRYRVRRIQEIFHLDLDDPDTRLVIWLSLRMAAED